MPLPRQKKTVSGYAKPLSKTQYKAVAKIANKAVLKRAEKKILDTDVGNLAANTTTGVVVTKVTPPSQGDSASSRDGDQIYVNSLHFRSMLNCQANQNNEMRLIIIQWLEDDADATPVLGDILQNTGDLVSSMYVVNPARRYKILHDKCYMFDTNNGSVRRRIDVYIPGKKMALRKLSFNPAAATGVGQFYIITGGHQAQGNFDSTLTRLRYHDN